MKAGKHTRGVVVDSAIFRIESGGKIFWVMEERVGEDNFRFMCTCRVKYNCEHIEAVKAHISRHVKPERGKNENGRNPGHENQSFDSLQSIPPPAAGPALAPRISGTFKEKREKTFYGDPEKIAGTCESLKNTLKAILSGRIRNERDKLRRVTDELVKDFENIYVTDLLKSVADLRRAVLGETPDPIAVNIGIERVAGAINILEDFMNKLHVDDKLQTTYLGKVWEIGEIAQQEDVYLIEIARNTVLTPFGIRRSESYYTNRATGELFIEEKYHDPGGGNPSVGPFPRALHVNLMTIEPRLQPPAVNLLQYSVRPPPNEGDLLKIKTKAIDSVEAALNFYKQTVSVVRSPYPVFVTLAPLKTEFYNERLIMRDSEDDIIGLAYSSSPHGCLSVEKICSENHLHAICGLLVIESRYLAVNPLSLLIENGTGLKMMRIK